MNYENAMSIIVNPLIRPITVQTVRRYSQLSTLISIGSVRRKDLPPARRTVVPNALIRSNSALFAPPRYLQPAPNTVLVYCLNHIQHNYPQNAGEYIILRTHASVSRVP